MSGSYYMPLWTDAYLGDTKHLTTVQHGAYLLILMAMWRNGGTLPNEPKRLARIAGLTSDRWKQISREVLELLDTEHVDGTELVYQKRLRSEYEKTLTRAGNKRSAAHTRWGAKSLENNNVGHATASRVHMQEAMQNEGSAYASRSRSRSKKEDKEVESERDSKSEAKPTNPANDDRPDWERYEIVEGVVKLTEKTLDDWQKAYPSVNVRGECRSISEFANKRASEGANWFHVIQGRLGKLDRENNARRMEISARAEAEAKHKTAFRPSIV